MFRFLSKLTKHFKFKFSNYKLNYGIQQLKNSSRSKSELIKDLRSSIENQTGFAVSKIGVDQQHWMYYKILLNQIKNSEELKKFENELPFHFYNQQGLFPTNNDFIKAYNNFYIKHLRNLDYLGICHFRYEPEIIKWYRLINKLIYYVNIEPDKSIPDDPNNCYLQYFNSKRILIICPFAQLLRDRANREIFESVWSKTGKKWFYPSKVDSIEFPYGFSEHTQKKYDNALDLYKFINNEIKDRDFDIALVAAAGLSIPIVSSIKNMGKIGIDLGGHLQVLFGVLGRRWKDREDWEIKYFNDSWIDMPDKYKPKELKNGLSVCDDGAYW